MKWPFKWPRECTRTAKEALARAHRDDSRVTAVARRAKRLQQQNGFADAIRDAMGVPHDDR